MLRRILLILSVILLASPTLAADVGIVIDISDQRMRVNVGGERVHSWAVSTGRKGYATPRGTYGVTRMYKEYYSKKYDGAPMPYAIFFRGGYAIHGTYDTKRLGRVASHGCVRLSPDHARRLYSLVNKHGSGNVTIQVRG